MLTFKGLVSAGDNTAFIDQVQILSGTTGNTVISGAIANASFENSDPLARGTYGYLATGASWTFSGGAGIAAQGTGFSPATPPQGSQVAFVQGTGQLQQTLTLGTGTYRVRFYTAQRNFNGTNVQKLQVLIDGVVVADNLQPNSTTFSGANQFTTSAFTVGTSTPFALATLVPTRNKLAVDRASSVALSFNAAMTAAAMTDVSLFSNQYGGALTLKKPPVINGNTATLVPNRYFKAGEVVSVSVPNTVVSNSLGQASNNAQVYQFTVAAQNNGTGNGTFAGTQNADVGTNPRGVTMGDVDGDGRLDLIVASQLSVSVFRNLGNSGSPAAPTFAARTVLALPNNAIAYAVEVGDMDGDGRLDIVTANAGTGNVSVFRNTGTATGTVSFAASQQYNVADSAYGLALGDLDGDGDLDIVAMTYDGNNTATVSLLRNVIFSSATLAANGMPASSGALTASSFAPEVDFTIGNSVRYDVALGDLDGDGKLDIVTANYGPNTVGIYRNMGTSPAAFDFGDEEVIVPVGTSPYSVALGDMNSDGKLDIVTANRDADNVTILQSAISGPGTFSTGGGFPTSGRTSIGLGNGSEPISVALGDQNGDGQLDIMAANYGDGDGRTVSTLFRNAANNGFTAPSVTNLAGNGNSFGPRSVALGDLDGDGDLDFATANLTVDAISYRINGTTASALPLPVELVDFKAQCNGANTLLTWHTALEKNNKGFDVQRSLNGETFGSIGFVDGLGSSDKGGTYTITDERAPGLAYYRLRSVDFDGTAAYSPVVTSSCASSADIPMRLTLVPNPAQHHVQVLGATAAVQLLDLTGRVIRQQASPESLDLDGLAPGLYLVRSGTLSARLQVQ
ncbi:FG-GAP-like repeat-containing protein [Hymenobacter ruber]